MRLTKSSVPFLQRESIFVLDCLVESHTNNQSAATAAGAIPQLMQLKGSIPIESPGHAEIHALIDEVLSKLEQVPEALPPQRSNVAAFPPAVATPALVSAPVRRLAPSSRVRIEGLQGRPEMNGRTGVICGRLLQASMPRSC